MIRTHSGASIAAEWTKLMALCREVKKKGGEGSNWRGQAGGRRFDRCNRGNMIRGGRIRCTYQNSTCTVLIDKVRDREGKIGGRVCNSICSSLGGVEEGLGSSQLIVSDGGTEEQGGLSAVALWAEMKPGMTSSGSLRSAGRGRMRDASRD